MIAQMENMFNDKEQKGIILSTIHQAKGLESENIFFLIPAGAECPAPWARTKELQEVEKHLRYIGITRAKLNLYYVS